MYELEDVKRLRTNLEEAKEVADNTLKEEGILRGEIEQERKKVQDLTRELNDAKLKFQQFEVNTRYEREQELYKLRQEYEQQLQEQQQQQKHQDTEKLRQDCLSSVKKIQDASDEKIRLAQVCVNQVEQLLTRAEKKLSLLQNAVNFV